MSRFSAPTFRDRSSSTREPLPRVRCWGAAPQQVRANNLIRDVHRECADTRFRAGVKERGDRFLCGEEWQTAWSCSHRRTLLGPSIGIWSHEEPVLVADEEETLEVGFVTVDLRYFARHVRDILFGHAAGSRVDTRRNLNGHQVRSRTGTRASQRRSPVL